MRPLSKKSLFGPAAQLPAPPSLLAPKVSRPFVPLPTSWPAPVYLHFTSAPHWMIHWVLFVFTFLGLYQMWESVLLSDSREGDTMRNWIIHLVLNTAAKPSTTSIMKMKLDTLLSPFLLPWQMQNLLSSDSVWVPVLSTFWLISQLRTGLHRCYLACVTGEDCWLQVGPWTP